MFKMGTSFFLCIATDSNWQSYAEIGGIDTKDEEFSRVIDFKWYKEFSLLLSMFFVVIWRIDVAPGSSDVSWS